MAIKDCVFCEITKGDIPSYKIYEDKDIFVFLDINPVSAGHALIVPKKHFLNLEDTPDEIVGKMMAAAKKVSHVLKGVVGCGGFNLGLNSGRVAGQAIDHIHLHIMPRYKNDGLKLWPGRKVATKELLTISRAACLELEKG